MTESKVTTFEQSLIDRRDNYKKEYLRILNIIEKENLSTDETKGYAREIKGLYIATDDALHLYRKCNNITRIEK